VAGGGGRPGARAATDWGAHRRGGGALHTVGPPHYIYFTLAPPVNGFRTPPWAITYQSYTSNTRTRIFCGSGGYDTVCQLGTPTYVRHRGGALSKWTGPAGFLIMGSGPRHS
jgi:hypothetical protein